MPAKITIENHVAEVLLDHPPVNAFDSAGWLQLAKDIGALGENDDVHVALIHAAGKGFCAGVDIKELA